MDDAAPCLYFEMLENRTFILIISIVLCMVLIHSFSQSLLNTFMPGLFCILDIQKLSRLSKSLLSWSLKLLGFIGGVTEKALVKQIIQ